MTRGIHTVDELDRNITPVEIPTTLTDAEIEAVSGGMWPLVIGLAIGCALLLAHD